MNRDKDQNKEKIRSQNERINLNDPDPEKGKGLREHTSRSLKDVDGNLNEFGGTGNTVTSGPNHV